MTYPMNTDRNWLLKMAAAEDNLSVTSGNLLAVEDQTVSPVAFAKLVEQKRRELHLTVDQLAQRADVDVEEILLIESGTVMNPAARIVHQLAHALQLHAHP